MFLDKKLLMARLQRVESLVDLLYKGLEPDFYEACPACKYFEYVEIETGAHLKHCKLNDEKKCENFTLDESKLQRS